MCALIPRPLVGGAHFTSPAQLNSTYTPIVVPYVLLMLLLFFSSILYVGMCTFIKIKIKITPRTLTAKLGSTKHDTLLEQFQPNYTIFLYTQVRLIQTLTDGFQNL